MEVDNSTEDGTPRTSPIVPAHASNWRPDIQALRGWAVALVVLQHAGLSLLPGGYLGVDIFFVISGYLMGGILIRSVDDLSFTFAKFYARRVRRLLPAAYATVLATAMLAPFLLDRYELRDLLDQVAGAFTFSINFVLWQQVDYFGSGAELKPLLHMWSLAVEEQFYLVLPVLVVLCPKRWRLGLCIVVVLGSLMLCLYMVRSSPSAAFYLLPTRAWELGIGVLAAVSQGRIVCRFPVFRFTGLILLVVIPFMLDQRGHPGAAALAVCLATAAIILTVPARRKGRLLMPAVWLGDRSYALYLVHWPVFAFANNLLLDHAGVEARVGLLVLCLILAEALHRGVEQRFRLMSVNWLSLGVLIVLPTATVAVMAGLFFVQQPDLSERGGNKGLGNACIYEGNFEPRAECSSTDSPTVMVWGDSFAMHLVDGLDRVLPTGVMQATKTACGPFLGIAPMNGAIYTRTWAEQCIAFNQSVVDILLTSGAPQTVVISSPLLQYLPGGEPGKWSILHEGGQGVLVEGPRSADVLLAALERTVAVLRMAGKRVILVAPPPAANFDVGRCLRREDARIPTLSRRDGCNYSVAEYERDRAPVLNFLDEVSAAGVLEMVRFEDKLCRDGECQTRLNRVGLYRDAGWHFSKQGFALLAAEMNLAEFIGAQPSR